MENPLKVQAKINELNSREPRGGLGGLSQNAWVATVGYFALTGFDYNNGAPTFNAGFGVPVKVFTNIRTGEIKIYAASIFEG